MRDGGVVMPDLSTVKLYRVNITMEERVGDHVHVLHGWKAFDQITWTHLEIWDANDMALTADRCTQLAMLPRGQRGPVGH